MSTLKSLIGVVAHDTAFYGLANILSRSVTLFTLPLLARYLSVEEYGLFDLYYLSISLLITCFILGQDSSIFRYFYDENDNESRKFLVTQTIIFQLIISIIIIFVLFLIQDILIELIGLNNETIKFIKLLILIVPFGILYTISEAILRLTGDLKRYLVLTLGFMTMTLLVIFISTQIIEASLYFIFQLLLLVWCLFGFFGLFLIRKWLKIPQSFHNLKRMLFYGIPMGGVVLLESSQAVFERIIIANVVSAEGLGLFAVAAKIAIIVLLPVGAFQMAFMPLVMKIYRDNDSIKIFNLSLILYITGLTLLIIVLSAFTKPIIILLAGNNYIDGATVIFPLTMVIYFQAISSVLGIGTIISQKTYLRLLILIVAQIFTYCLMFYLGIYYGILGIAIAALAGKLFFMIFNIYLAQILHPLGWNYQIVAIMSSILLVYGSYLSLHGINAIFEIVIFMLMLIIILIIGWYFLSPEDKHAISFKD